MESTGNQVETSEGTPGRRTGLRVLITGANCLVGQGVLKACLAATDISEVTALGRHASGSFDLRLREILCADFASLAEFEDQLQPFDAYRHVTLTLTTHVARTLARLNPALTFIYISGAYADPDSRIMPMRIKGETERALAELPITTVMVRPGVVQPVDGVKSPRARMRSVYWLAAPLMGAGVMLTPALMTTTTRVGRAMLRVLRNAEPQAVVENRQINRLGQ